MLLMLMNADVVCGEHILTPLSGFGRRPMPSRRPTRGDNKTQAKAQATAAGLGEIRENGPVVRRADGQVAGG
jgi:hypothetical protein